MRGHSRLLTVSQVGCSGALSAAICPIPKCHSYVVDNIAGADSGEISVRVLHGEFLKAMLDRATPHITYWPTLRTADYDQMQEESRDRCAHELCTGHCGARETSEAQGRVRHAGTEMRRAQTACPLRARSDGEPGWFTVTHGQTGLPLDLRSG